MKRPTRESQRQRRHFRVRKKVAGTAQRPRLAVYRSHLHMYAQLVDDTAGKTLTTVSTQKLKSNGKSSQMGTVEAARHLGELVAQSAKSTGIRQVVFDRGGYRYHGRVKALADGVRSQGVEM